MFRAFKECAEHDEGKDNRYTYSAQRHAVDAVGQQKELFNESVVGNAVVREAAGHILSPYAVGEESAGDDDKRPAGRATGDFQRDDDEAGAVENILIRHLIDIFQPFCKLFRMLKHINIDGYGNRNQHQIHNQKERIFLLSRFTLTGGISMNVNMAMRLRCVPRRICVSVTPKPPVKYI